MHIAIFGASGSTGRHLVSLAAANGHQLTVFGRSADRLPDPGPDGRSVIGDVTDPQAVSQAMAGVDAVIIALGAPPSDRSGLRGQGTATILRAMRSEGVERVVCMSCLGVGDSYEAQDWFTRRVVLDLWLWRVVADHAVQEALLQESGLAWTIVRPPHLSDKVAGDVQLFDAHERTPASSVARADLAAFMLECAERNTHGRQTIGVCAA